MMTQAKALRRCRMIDDLMEQASKDDDVVEDAVAERSEENYGNFSDVTASAEMKANEIVVYFNKTKYDLAKLSTSDFWTHLDFLRNDVSIQACFFSFMFDIKA